ncbi:MAG: hypothetical protein M3463_11670, partial [Verrucomicrobiota bacterium]|nr:hypothetical protein [Verrucomicrobiota bacterium]
LGSTGDGQTVFCLPNWGIHDHVKLLGYIDLPGMATPNAVTASSCSPNLEGGVSHYDYRFATAAERAAGWVDESYGRAGFAVVTSELDGKAAFIDLQPLLARIREQYFTSQLLADAARNAGFGAGQWPYTFAQDASMQPRLIKVVDVPSPSAVRASLFASEGRPAVAVIASRLGKVHVFELGDLATEDPADANDVRLHATVQVGANPCAIAYQHFADPFRYDQGVSGFSCVNWVFLICCRGDREIAWLEVTPSGAAVYRRFRDSRLVDPVNVHQNRINSENGGYFFAVCDFKGRKVVNYRVGPVRIHDGWIELPAGAPEVECTGWMDFPGHPFALSADNVP